MKVWNYIKKLIQSDSLESSKRAIALFTVLLITYTVALFTNHNNATTVLSILCSFVLALVGVAAWQQIKNK